MCSRYGGVDDGSWPIRVDAGGKPHEIAYQEGGDAACFGIGVFDDYTRTCGCRMVMPQCALTGSGKACLLKATDKPTMTRREGLSDNRLIPPGKAMGIIWRDYGTKTRHGDEDSTTGKNSQTMMSFIQNNCIIFAILSSTVETAPKEATQRVAYILILRVLLTFCLAIQTSQT